MYSKHITQNAQVYTSNSSLRLLEQEPGVI